MVHVAAIIQARMGSTRFPGKVLRLLAETPLIEHIIKRLRQVSEIDLIALALPLGPLENPLARMSEQLGVPCVQGPEDDVLARYIQAGDFFGAQHIVRVCGDNPLIDLTLLRSLIRRHLDQQADYTFSPDPIPLGTGSEIVRLAALKTIALKTEKSIYREHVTTYFQDHPQDFHLQKVPAPGYLKNQNFRLTVDTEKDFNLMEELFQKLSGPGQPIVNLEKVLTLLRTRPDLACINSGVTQKDWRK